MTEKSSPQPGPWHERAGHIYDAHGSLIAVVMAHDTPVGAANARLIAAAGSLQAPEGGPLPPLPPHPDERVFTWTSRELAAIKRYGEQCARAALAAQAAPVALTADDLREPKNGTAWRVEWWNESARLMLPAGSKLDSFQAYKNGTLMFTIKRADQGATNDH